MTNKGLIDDQLWTRLVDRIVADEHLDRVLAERAVDQTLGFLKRYADDPTRPLAPTPLVDVGWHTFILYTREYQEFCLRTAGAFIHHAPDERPGRTCSTWIESQPTAQP